MKKVLLVLLLVVVTGLGAGWWYIKNAGPEESHAPIPAGANTDLVKHSELFKKGVVKVLDNIHVAIGYGISNSIMIEGDGGLIIVDTMTTNEEASEVLAEFRKISTKPIKAIIYTHSHPDHVFGSGVFASEGNPDVYAHETTADIVKHLVTEVRPIIASRSMRMYGNFLGKEAVYNVGIGPLVGMEQDSTVSFIQPTKTFSDRLETEIAGIRVSLFHTGGETDDQIALWLPDQKVLIPGDNFYWTFPNLYTIRGTTFRSLKNWYNGLDKMRDLKAEYLVPCHTRPIIGAEKIQKILTDYRDAIQFVHDQSIRGINMGLTPDDLVEFVKLPEHLARAPYLQPFYGKVSWSVRSMFSGNLGWFDGDAAHLQPLSPNKEAELIASIAGGNGHLLEKASEMLGRGEYQAALQITGYVIRLEKDNPKAREIRIKALTALGEKEQNPNARHYYLTEAMELRDDFVAHELSANSPEILKSFTLASFFDSLVVNLDPEKSLAVNQKAGMTFPDLGETFVIHVRHGVAEIRQCTPEDLESMDLDIKVTADSMEWKALLGKIKGPMSVLPGFTYEKGNTVTFAKFLTMFAPGPMKLACE